MCEFKVFLKKNNIEEIVSEDIIYAKVNGSSIVFRGILGNELTVDKVSILEVDVSAERLILTPMS